MAALSNIRHERFARALIKTGVAATAYLAAGYAPTTRNALDVSACQLLRRPKVQARIRELRKQMAARNRITVDSLIDELREDRQLARKNRTAERGHRGDAAHREAGRVAGGSEGERRAQRTERGRGAGHGGGRVG
jgi:phage terminase small subunit